ncbi:MAG TPA: serine--tRNA ligase [Phycisphaerales bacterium]|nr:serine--tRNA ligase [Phycisphaerales bacterium]
MIDIKLIRENPEPFKTACKAKNFYVDIDRLLQLDGDLRKAKTRLQEITTEKNTLGKSIPKLSGDEKQNLLNKLAEYKNEEAALNDQIKKLEPELDELMLQVPQPADDDVPFGKDDTENVEIAKWGEIRQFDFEPKDHIQLGMALDIIDVERAVRLAGTRNYFLKGAGAMLHWAILRFSIDFMVSRGYVPFSVPMLMKNEAMAGTGYYPGSEEQTYRMERDELNLAGTAEVPLTAYYMGEILAQEKLPQKFVGLSTCYRREAGAAGKDTYGLYRIHQFDKVEQVVICENNEDVSRAFHTEILGNSEGLMQALEIPYRVVNVCTGDLGRGQVMKYDIEAWMPGRGDWGEVASDSIMTDFQSRRANIRYRDAEGTIKYVHMLNNTALASTRTLIALWENYQQEDGTVKLPDVLK